MRAPSQSWEHRKRTCKHCGCPFFDERMEYSSDRPKAWKDSDGVWYCGPAWMRIHCYCRSCNYSFQRRYERGKFVEEFQR